MIKLPQTKEKVKRLLPKINESKIRNPEGLKRVYINSVPVTSICCDVQQTYFKAFTYSL